MPTVALLKQIACYPAELKKSAPNLDYVGSSIYPLVEHPDEIGTAQELKTKLNVGMIQPISPPPNR